jgi:hypothetical protein
MKNRKAYGFVILAFALMLWIGYYNETWKDIWVVWMQGDTQGRDAVSAGGVLFTNPKLWATTIMSIVYMLISVLTMGLMTQSRMWIGLSIGVYAMLMFASLSIYLIGTFSHQFFYWQSFAQDIKMLVQSPFVLGILLAAYHAWQYIQKDLK